MTVEPPPDDAVEAFWEDARVRANLNRLRAYTGPNVLESLRPPVWAFGSTPEDADALLALVLSGRKTATSSALRDYEDGREELPATGALSIVTDGAGRPRALLRTTEVRIVPFDEVDADHARAEGEGDLSLGHWRDVHRRFFSESAGGAAVPPDLPVVLERFQVLHSVR